MKRHILIMTYERKLATTNNPIKIILYNTILKILDSKLFNKDLVVVDMDFWGDVMTDDLEEDLEKKYYKWS